MSTISQKYGNLSPLKQALLALEEMGARLDKSERERLEPIAIIGMGCRFPGANDPEAFWRLMENGVDAVKEIPGSRWSIEDFYDPDPDAPGKMSTRRRADAAGRRVARLGVEIESRLVVPIGQCGRECA